MIEMERSIIDQYICEQVKDCGKDHVVYRYNVMRSELEAAIMETKDCGRASVLSDVLTVIDKIIDGVKK